MFKEFLITEENVSEYANNIGNWIADMVVQNNRRGVVLGMSGGVDCCVVARLCQIANVDCYLIMLPYQNNMLNDDSFYHSKYLIEKFGFRSSLYDIKDAVNNISDDCACYPEKLLVLGNIKARVRMTYLYTIAQEEQRFVIGTSNLSERFTGYCTKWGDMACDLNPLGNLTKREVYVLARYLEVPDSIINKPPSAGLWVGQTDENELGFSYEELDDFILNGTSGLKPIDVVIMERYNMSQHKRNPIPMFGDEQPMTC